MKKIFTLAIVLLCAYTVAQAIPAKRGFTTYTQADGSTITLQLSGDEWCHSLVTQDGYTVILGDDGNYYYRTLLGATAIQAHNEGERTSDELSYLAVQGNNVTMAALSSKPTQLNRVKKSTSTPKRETQVPNTGTPNVPIILVQYTDKKMSNTKATFEQVYNTDNESAYQYFVDQSNGKYKPNFVLFGIYTLSSTRATYGGNDSNDYDKGLGKMVTEAINLADDDGADFSIFDNDGDGEVDVVIVVYAGVGEAQASNVTNSVWPCQWSLSDAYSYNSSDGNGSFNVDGVKVDKFAVFNEINGSSDSSTKIDGIGTFCHEFSHCLGLPDFYETTYSNGYYGMGSWSLMDYGSYNNDGYTPIGYSAYEKAFMGWIDLIDPVENTYYTLPVLNQKSEETDKAVKIVSDLNSNEYFIIENRAQQGWDAYIPDEGLLVHHYTYVSSRWEDNTVNDKKVQLATILPADNKLTSSTEAYDCYPYNSKDSVTDNSSPATTLNMYASGSLASSTGGAGSLGKPVTDMVINSDGSASFWYIKGAEPTLETYAPVMLEADANYVTSSSFKAEWTDETPSENVESYTLYVNAYDPSASETLLTEAFGGVEATSDGTTNIASSLDTYCDNSGWTGAYVYLTSGGLKLGSSKYAGYVTTPELDLSGSNGTITVKFNAKYYNNDASSIVVSCGDVSETVELTSTAADYTVVLEGVTEAAGQTVTLSCTAAKKRLYLYSVEVATGDASSASLMASETGDASYRVITGITDKSYTVTGLTAGATYKFYVVANYTDGTNAKSNIETVTLLEEGEQLEKYAPVMLAADADYITTSSFRADWTDETPEENVTDYTLYVNIVESEDPDPDPDPDPEVTVTTLLTETFGGVEATSDGTQDINASLDTYCDNSGWTGYAVYLTAGGLKLGAGSKLGYVTSPELDLSTSGGTVTVKLNAASWVNSSGTSDGTSIVVSCGDVSQTVELSDEAADYTVVLTGVTAESGQTVKIAASASSKQRFYLYSVTIYSGDATTATLNAARKAVSETGDATYRIITGITDKYYVVENLTAGATYEYYVVANYTDGTTAQSNTETVTLLTEQAHSDEWQLGDVNHDHVVDITDVTALIDRVLNGEPDKTIWCDICGDINGDGTIDITDVTGLIDLVLAGGSN